MRFIDRFLPATQESFFLLGPRGTGKSTWLQHTYPDAYTINLLDPSVSRLYGAKPERLYDTLQAVTQREIIIDEIQKVPELLSVVHDVLEQKRGLQFILTGSSARKLKRTGVNLLAGRALLRHLYPFMAAELQQAFNLNSALTVGMLPVILDSDRSLEKIHAYMGLYLKEEVQSEGLVRNVGDFARFLEIVSFSHAQQLNMSNVSRECSISRKIVESYFSILEDLLMSFKLPVFMKRAKRLMVSHTKFYLFDTGVFRALRSLGPLDSRETLNGIALEGLVAQHLYAWNDYQNKKYTLSYWRTRAGNEVDFIIYGPDGFWAIEVKAGECLHPKDFHGLQSFAQDYPEATLLLLYCGNVRMKKGNILCIPVTEFLLCLNPQFPISEMMGT